MSKRMLRFSALTLTLSFIVLSMIGLAMFALPVVYGWEEIVEKHNIEHLSEDATLLADMVAERGIHDFGKIINGMVQEKSNGVESLILLANPARAAVAGNLSHWPADIPAKPGVYATSIVNNGKKIDAIFVSRSLPGDYSLLVGRNNTSQNLIEMLFWSGLCGATGVIFLFGMIARRVIRSTLLDEIQRISHTTAAIVGGDLTRRLPQKNGGNELDLLAATVNRTLDQIELLIHANRQISDSIAHDLRTPLAELRFRLESLTLEKRPVDEILNEVDASIVDVDRVIMVFNALLRLAEIDHGARRSGFEQVNINKMVEDVVDFYHPLAELKGIPLTFEQEEKISTSGDALLLAQAIGNLIDNALKYTNSKVWVTVRFLPDLDRISITVSDDGIGISDDDKPKVVERFYRSNTSHGTEGVGLGLSLVAAVARLHGGAFLLRDANPGLHASLLIPTCGKGISA